MEQEERGKCLASARSLLITDLPRHIESRAQITAASEAGTSKTSSGPVMKPMKNGGSRSFGEVTVATTASPQVVGMSIDGRMADDTQVEPGTLTGGASYSVAWGAASETIGGEKAGGVWTECGAE
jgi:hypothetical protein